MFKGRRSSAALVLLLLVTLLSSCGGESATATPRQSTVPQSTTGSTTQGLAAAPTNTTAMLMPTATAAASAPTATTGAAAAVNDQMAMAAATATQGSGVVAQEPKTVVEPAPVYGLNPLISTTQDHLSTFALDVDTGSYTQARNYINAGDLPPADTVRIEEFVNYFNYHYAPPQDEAFAIHVDAAPSPFNGGQTELVRVGVQGKVIDAAQRQDAVLTFVIDISGSMEAADRLPLVKQALRLLVNELRESDQVAIVVYGSDAKVLLDHTSAANKDRILQAIDSLHNEGSTNAEAGLRLGYKLAGQNFKTGGSNRVILCSDGVANVGATGPDSIRASIRDYAAQGIYITTVGFGMGDYNDNLMEQLADDGDGNYAYVDTLEAAKRIFVQNLTGTLQVIAKDAKVQVDFNPAAVQSYRLLGYQNRAVADSDFRNDKVDAGEIGSGHAVTALYEVVRQKGASGPVLTVQMRYADPKTGDVTELRQDADDASFVADFAATAPGFQLAVAAAGFAQHLHGGVGEEQAPALGQVLEIAQRVVPQLANDPEPQELLDLITRVGSRDQ